MYTEHSSLVVKTFLVPKKLSKKVFCVADLLRNEAVLVLLLQMLLHQCRMILYLEHHAILWTIYILIYPMD